MTGGAAAVPAGPSTQPGAVPAEDPRTSLALNNETGITTTNVSGPGIAIRQNDTVYVWQDGSLVVNATMFPIEKPGEHRICLDLRNETDAVAASYGCRNVDVKEHGSRTSFNLETLSTNGTGPHELELTLEDFEGNDTARLPVVVVTRDGDLDGDSLNNSREVALGTGINDQDTDSDGLLDGLEVTKYETDPKEADSDDDGLNDGRELNLDTDPMNPDTDGDGLTDGEEVNEYGTDPKERDTDGDGLTDPRELKLGTNPREEDTDGDGLDDGAEVEQGTHPLTPNDPESSPTGDGEPSPSDNPLGLSNQATMLVVGAGTVLAGLAVAAGYVRRRGERDAPDLSEADAPDPEAESSVDPELLSPEQHVLHLLEQNGGQMKQSQFVEETDWSKAKVSRKLSQLEEAGEIERVRIGRENVVTTPDHDLGDDT